MSENEPLFKDGVNPWRDVTLEIIKDSSARAPSEPAGSAPVVGSGGVVGLRAESVTTLIERWAKHSGQWKTDASNHRRSKDPAAKISAERCEGRAAIYAACIEDMRAEMASENQRQPEPNISMSQPGGQS